MKPLCIVLVFLATIGTANASTTRVLLEYNFGNQITRSSLIVLSNGMVMKNETLMGVATYLPDVQISAKEVESLSKMIDTAALASQLRNDDIAAAEGGAYGEAKINTSDGSSAILYTIVAGELFKKTVVCQAGVEADEIRDFIQKIVRDQMPLELAPCK